MLLGGLGAPPQSLAVTHNKVVPTMDKEMKRGNDICDSPDVEICRPVDGPAQGLKRDLGSRHINMIAIAGMIVRVEPNRFLLATRY